MRRLWPWALAALAGCVPVESQTRTERGPLLRSFDRPQVVEGGVRGTVEVAWPKATVSVNGYDTCRTLHLEEYAEEKTTERSSPSAGPALSIGVVGTAVGLGLLAATPAFSNAPNKSVIDGSGHYGAPPRTIATGWGIGTAIVGLPALVVGLVGYFHQGEETETTKVEQVSGQEDRECNLRPMAGPAQWVGEKGPVGEVKLVDGKGVVDASELKSSVFDKLVFYGRPVELDEASRRALDAFSACLQLEQQPVADVSALGTTDLLQRAERARSCQTIRSDLGPVSKVLEDELNRRREGGEPLAQPAGAKVDSYEGALAAYQPKLRLEPGGDDLKQLDHAEQLVNQAVQLTGVVEDSITANIGVVQVGDKAVYLFIPAEHGWGGDFGPGSRVEVVAVVTGMQTLDERTLPLLRAVWMRAAVGGN